MNKLENRIPLGFYPTPLQRLQRLSAIFPEYQIFIKRDDQTGLALGGNKTRKLEYLFWQAKEQGCDTVITAGAAQSNHCRQTAAAAAVAGLECHLVLRGRSYDKGNGNLLLDKLLNATIHWAEDRDRTAVMHEVAEALLKKGRRPYLIPIGGSNQIGCLGYVRALSELKAQLDEEKLKMDYLVFASSSGGTQAGLLLGKKMFDLKAELVGINIDKDELWDVPLEEYIARIATQAANWLGLKVEFNSREVNLNRQYDAAGYGVVTSAEIGAINLLARTEGIILDPVYSGRAFAGLIDQLERKKFPRGANILFWHTGGLPALFHYYKEIWG